MIEVAVTGYKRNQNRDEHQNGITAIPTSVAAFFVLYYTQIFI